MLLDLPPPPPPVTPPPIWAICQSLWFIAKAEYSQFLLTFKNNIIKYYELQNYNIPFELADANYLMVTRSFLNIKSKYFYSTN